MDEIKNLRRLIKMKKEQLQKDTETLGEVENWEELLPAMEKELEKYDKKIEQAKDECYLPSSKKKAASPLIKEKDELRRKIGEYKEKMRTQQKLKSVSDEISQSELEVEELEKAEYSPGEAWRFINEKKDTVFNENVKNETLKRIKDMKITDMLAEKKWVKLSDDKDVTAKQIPKFINAILIGNTGVGKSSYINTCATALKSDGEISNLSMDQQGSTETATIKLLLSPLRLPNNETLMVRLFDCKGICEDMGRKEMEMIIKGHIKSNAEITNASEMENNPEKYRENPGLANQMHCIVYVVRADRSESSWKETLDEVTALRKLFTGENIPQCLLLTAVDTMGVPENDVKNIYKYPCVKHLCERAARDIQLPMKYVLPMSNYHSEGTPSHEKDALALHTFWKILHYGKEYILKNENRKDIPEGFYD